jgi:membrane-bound lytic murein transglycosylase A
VLACLGLVSCATAPPPLPARGPDCMAAEASTPEGLASQAIAAEPPVAAPPSPARPQELRTRNAVFKTAAFDELPGWRQDDLRAGWSAFLNSCRPLQQREAWREPCQAARSVPAGSGPSIRSFFESRFTVLRILNSDASREGELTGYFEPLLEGSTRRLPDFAVPVLGVPADLYTLDWARVPASQRRQVIRVRPEGDRLVPVAAQAPGTYAMDLRRFTLDDRDRRLRARLVRTPGAEHVAPYHSRAELEALGLPAGIDAPVLAWVNDPLALYAMQVQGSGRIRLADGSILRLQYGEQNGHPFRPLRVVPVARAVTRGLAVEAPERFTLDDTVDDAADGAPASEDAPVLTRGTRPQAAPAPSDPLVDELLKNAERKKKPAATAPAPAAVARPAKPPARSIVAPTPKPATAALAGRLSADPSYVFFRRADNDRPAGEGPRGALGVPLTAGRSVAVDPRVTPLGYPLYLSAPAPAGSKVQVQRLVFAQDTGGAIRGALRADYFWGFGNEAGQSARRTRHRGQMWVMLPNAEAARLASSSLVVTRGIGTPGDAAPATLDQTCLVADGDFCAEAD